MTPIRVKHWRCRYCKEVEIYFDSLETSSEGKLIPLEYPDGNRHNCSARPLVVRTK